MNKFWNNGNNENGNSTQVQTQAGRNNMKKLTIGIIAGLALTVVIGTSAMLSTAEKAQASEELAGRISTSSSMPKLIDPSNVVFVDESAVTLNTFKLTDPRNGVVVDESAVESSIVDIETYRDNQNPKLIDPSNGVFVDESAVTPRTFKLVDPRNGVYVDESAVTN